MKNLFLFLFLLLTFELFSQKENSNKDTISKVFQKNDTISIENYLQKRNSTFLDTVPYFTSPLLNSEKNIIYLLPELNAQFFVSRNEIRIENPLVLSIYQPLTLIQYAIGSGEYQQLNLSHYQRIFKNLHFVGTYDRNKSTGFYQNQKTIKDNLSIQINSDHTKKYFLKANYHFTKMKMAENGGITSDSLFETQSVLNPMTLDVNLQSAQNNFLYHQVDLENNFKIKNTDFYNRLNYRFNYRNYSDDPGVGFYEFIFLDSNATNDRYEINSFESATGIKIKSSAISLDFYIGNEKTIYQSYSVDTSYFNNSVNIRLNYRNKLNLTGFYYVTGYQKNNYLVCLNYSKYLTKYSTNLKFTTTFKQNNPEMDWQILSLNNYDWRIQMNPQLQNSNSLVVSNKFGILTVLNTNYLNYYFLNSEIIAEQRNDLISILSFIYKYNVENKNLIFKSAITYQINIYGEEVYRIPTLIAYAELGFKMHLKALKINSGFNAQYFSSYYANVYNPALNNFYLQNEKKTGGYPYASLFVKTEVGKVHFKFCVNHVNEGLLKTPYYSTLHFPNNPRNYQISLSWLFKD